ncbi:MAG: hypothetical protein AB8G96_08060 [Phycisphaerales bacterium]
MTLARTVPSSTRRGVTLTEVAAATASIAVLAGLTLPALARAGNDALTDMSLANLRVLGQAHAAYATEWNGRQATVIPDTYGAYGDSPNESRAGYITANGAQNLPGIGLGWDETAPGNIIFQQFQPITNITNARLMEPLIFDGISAELVRQFGSFRFSNAVQFRSYVSARFYDPVFYAPADAVVSPIVDPLFDSPHGFITTPAVPGLGSAPVWSSYILSPAAMFDPGVMRAEVATPNGFKGGWADPYSLDDGFRSPHFNAARYPNLKTLMIEHHWLQNAPKDPCNPAFESPTYAGCEPYYFNHSIDSAPATIFFDGSTRLLPTSEAVASDERLRAMNGGGDGTWSRTTPFGDDGYRSELSFDGTQVSHHVLTADGILGRDTLGPDKNPPDAGRPARRNDVFGGNRIGRGRVNVPDRRPTSPGDTSAAPVLLDHSGAGS